MALVDRSRGFARLLAVTVLAHSFSAGALAQTAAPLAPLAIDGDVAAGRTLAYVCAGCHGIPGYRNAYPSYHVPKLGGQNADYLEVALQGYRRGTRHHQTMQAQAASLSDQDIADLAAYFASVQAEPGVGASSASRAAIENGRREANSCRQCHGAAGEAESPQWPNLAGQHASYIVAAIEQYREGARADFLMGPMIGQLNDRSIANVAAFYAPVPGLSVAEP